ncbi:MAG: alpha/beta fold hydrolase [Chloracidobacterium sp.]|uniref:Alpha/beta fold hydrolase n=1 Tax=Chloracidobacterium validum TaxID=2821543 RepID=A0ABX8BEK5_9BACT|nr:alpha/beta fold hydrolase [Chloracidobacterium validum]QUW04063.1 alpha/beta fold hydrolase [Chloracidobacterium validum]
MTQLAHITRLVARLGKKPNIAPTPSRTVYQENKLRVLGYEPARKRRKPAAPVLIVNSLVNKYYILDLTPGKSFVAYLAGEGIPVYMIDWGVPDAGDARLTLAHHVNQYLAHSVEAVCADAQAEQVALLGYCMGGTLALMYTALHPARVRGLALLATPVDFNNDAILNLWTRRDYFDVDKLVDTLGNPPEQLLQSTFMMMKPTKNLTKYVDLLQNAENDDFVETFLAFDYWVNDVVSLPGETFRQFVKWCYQENQLVQGKLKLGRRVVRLEQITVPLLNVVANHDDVVPRVSSEALMPLVGSQKKALLAVNGGHHGLSIGKSAVDVVWPGIARWVRQL